MRVYSMLFVFALYSFAFSGTVVHAEGSSDSREHPSQKEMVQTQLENLGVDELMQYWKEVVNEYGGYLPESQTGSLMDYLKGEKQFSIQAWFSAIVKFSIQEVLKSGKLLGSLIVLTVLCALLQSLQNAFEQGTVSKVAYAVVFMVLIVIALNSFHIAIQYSKESIERMTHFSLAFIPLLLALIAASGGAVSAAFFHPVMIFLMNTSGLFIQNIVFPLLFLSVVVSMVSLFSKEYKATQLASLLRNWSIGLLGILMAVFLGVVSVQGTATAVTDGLAVRTAKFVTGNFVPVIGRMLTETADTVISASVLLKNTVGIAGMAIILIIAAFPAVKILLIALIYKVAAAVLQPIGAGPVITCLDIMSKSILYVFAALAIVSIMFFLCITIIVTAGNITMMMR
ncbi:stage III sporulation protein AE [Bacillus smithii]|uniref:Stage III sporulation protein AE n=1 Tax=Bacillus smithii 7_3_47FAA TaxID=665952 RepID=G9QPK8_9BACI|nr:stage III sporulation protein AE [Bacillus smithii]EHL73649.1 stage III sporulation protein AE [Bacillus smithii 7_3_47FAA]